MKLLNFLKLDYTSGATDYKTNCLWCGHNALEIGRDIPHPFQCWFCKKTGNAWTLLQKYYEELPPLRPSHGREISEWKPGVKGPVLLRAGIKPSPSGYIWPVFSKEKTLNGLYRYEKASNTFYSSPKPCASSILGLENLRKEGLIVILEGHWDYATFLSTSYEKEVNVLGLCGSSWPTTQLQILESREVIFLADNDQAGVEGVNSMASRMKKAGTLPLSLQYLDWDSLAKSQGKDPYPDKFDIRDLYCSL